MFPGGATFYNLKEDHCVHVMGWQSRRAGALFFSSLTWRHSWVATATVFLLLQRLSAEHTETQIKVTLRHTRTATLSQRGGDRVSCLSFIQRLENHQLLNSNRSQQSATTDLVSALSFQDQDPAASFSLQFYFISTSIDTGTFWAGVFCHFNLVKNM